MSRSTWPFCHGEHGAVGWPEIQGRARDFWSKANSQLFGNPLISSSCRSNSLSRQTGNFLERIRNQKRDNTEPKTTEQRLPTRALDRPTRERSLSLPPLPD